MSFRVIHLSKSTHGGAGIAAYNTHKAINSFIGIESSFVSQNKYRFASTKSNGLLRTLVPLYSWLHQKISNIPLIFSFSRTVSRSCNFMPTSWHKLVNNGDFDIVVVHWVGSGGLSMGDLAKFSIPVIWVLHDMWIFCGTEHVSSEKRYIDGYKKKKLFDIDRFFWKKKKEILTSISTNITFVAPSSWMYKCAINSKMLQGLNVSIVNNPIDTIFWRESLINRNHKKTREHFSEFVITFGSSSFSYLKGAKIFLDALNYLHTLDPKKVIFINYVGKVDQNILSETPFKFKYYGFIEDKEHLKRIYNESDVCIFPSYIESFGQMAAEAALTNTPTIVYSNTGSADFIIHGCNGYLFSDYNSKCLSETIIESLTKLNIDTHALCNLSEIYESLTPEFVAKKYYKLILKTIQDAI